MNYPTWADVFIPQNIVNILNELKPSYILDSLVHQFVFRNKRRAHYNYLCHNCGNSYKPERSSEEVTYCQACNGKKISIRPSIRWSKDIPFYSRKNIFRLEALVVAMNENYFCYFLEDSKFSFDCGWEFDLCYSQFCGGQKAYDTSPRTCMMKAALLCPFLWDTSFNWSDRQDKVNTEHLSSVINLIQSENR